MRIPWRLPQPGTQLRILSPQRLNQPRLLRCQLAQLRDLTGELFMRRCTTHPTSITRYIPKSTKRAVKAKDQLSSYHF
jgi:hypothetical protein